MGAKKAESKKGYRLVWHRLANAERFRGSLSRREGREEFLLLCKDGLIHTH